MHRDAHQLQFDRETNPDLHVERMQQRVGQEA